MSLLAAPPTQLPIDFYSPAWYNALPPGLKDKVADTTCVALLPNAAESFLMVPHPSEALSSKEFNKKYYARIIKDYELIVAAESDEEDLERRGNVDVREELDDGGEGIDLQMPSDWEDANDDKYYAEGECGNLYDDEGENSRWIELDKEEDADYDPKADKMSHPEAPEDGIDVDGDQVMSKSGKGKEKASG